LVAQIMNIVHWVSCCIYDYGLFSYDHIMVMLIV